MSETRTFFQNRIVSGEKLLDIAENLKIEIGFVPVGEPMVNIAPSYNGSIALTNQRLLVHWVYDGRYRVYSTLAIYGLSERYFIPGDSKKWPYQAIVILSGGISLVVETIDRATSHSAEELSRFLTNALFLLGKRDADNGGITAMNAHLEELRRQEDQRRSQDTD